ncbi:MAG TPA: isoprenylcysteine carboxylmethyltransferase family protein [Blastocatellia bacterium]|nr:isoprenylcysteine carboxylmethyltransferase family protein [Blastocatellia bacterium]
MTLRKLTSPYFAMQAFAILAWWLVLWFQPATRSHFLPPSGDDVFLLAFCLPDLLLLVIGSLAAAILCWREKALASVALWLVIGSLGYATLYCLSLSLFTNAAWISVVMMAVSLGASLVLTLLFLYPTKTLFRQARQASPSWNLAKTFGQITIFWSFFLFALPELINRMEIELGIPRFQLAGQRWVAMGLFGLLSALGLWSGVTMSWFGSGTPLPVDGTRQLVMSGPYAYVRNPMALAGLGQGVAVGVYLGSLLVMVYSIVGSLVWNYVARPLEEVELVEKFGAPYERYRAEVKCWWPRLSPYRIVKS